jgi:hypothetical protein
MLAEKKNRERINCYTNAYYDYCPLPFYAEYNDYGAGENNNGIGLSIIMDAIREKLFEFEKGENQYHDIAVKKDDFDATLMWEAAHEGRLAINNYSKVPRNLVPVMVHGDIFDHILDNVTKDYYYYDEAGEFASRKYCFREILNDLPEYVMRLRCAIVDRPFFSLDSTTSGMFKDSESNLAMKWLSYTDRNTSFLFDMSGYLAEHLPDMTDKQAIEFLTEYLKGLWLNVFMDETNKVWIQPKSAGQESDQVPFQILNDAVQKVFAEERKYFDDDEDEE